MSLKEKCMPCNETTPKPKKRKGSCSMSGSDCDPSRRLSSRGSKKNKDRCNEQQQQSLVCTCQACGGQPPPIPCMDDLETIEEEQEPEVPCTVQSGNNVSGPCQRDPCQQRKNPCPQCFPPPPQCEEEDACGEFFDIMRGSMEDAVKKSLEDVFATYFSSCMEKIETLSSEMDRTCCMLQRVFTDLNDKISYYGERNAQQFQYLCVRMEHDRLFYQQQQEYFLKERDRLNDAKDADLCSTESCQVNGTAGKCRFNPTDMDAVGGEERHKKGQYWECTLAGNECGEDENNCDDDTTKKIKGSSGSVNGKRSPKRR